MLVLKPDGWNWRPLQWNWKPTLAALVLALVVLWSGYFFHVSHFKVGDGKAIATFPNRGLKTWPTKSQLHLNLIVPAGEFFEGLREVAFSNKHGRPAWFFGKIYPTGGIKLYYPAAIVLKWPTVLLALLLASVAARRPQSVPCSRRSAGDVHIRAGLSSVRDAVALRHRRAPHSAALSVRAADRGRPSGST